ncbi:MAG: CaiB/BaiF CoA transferase family protein [Vulcanimicrobiaceae bacterium]
MTNDSRTKLPLDGLRVLEFGHIAAAPFAGMLLADLGAEVVKVEPPAGDGLRSWAPIVEGTGGEPFSLNFASLNRNKRSVVADLKEPGQLARVHKLCRAADVLIENYRPGAMDRLGLGFQHVSALKPTIVYCSISGYGQTGPYANYGAFDVVVQGMSGLMSVTGEEDGPPVKCGVPVGDFTAGLYAVYSILAARLIVERDRRPVHLDCPMLDCLLGISALQTSEYWGTGEAPRRLGARHPRNAPYQAFEASDAPFIIAAGNNELWRQVCEATDKVELLEDSRFLTVTGRAKHQSELAAILAPGFRVRTAAEWMATFRRRGVPCGPINTFADILDDEHVRATNLVHELPIPGGLTRTVGYPVRFSGSMIGEYGAPPRLGEDTDDVFERWTADEPIAEHPDKVVAR